MMNRFIQLWVALMGCWVLHSVPVAAAEPDAGSQVSGNSVVNLAKVNRLTQPIAPQDALKIQGISHAVLAAKHNQVADPNALQLKQSLEALHQSLENLNHIGMLQASELRPADDHASIQPQSVKEATANPPSGQAHQRQLAEQEVSQQVAQIRQQLVALRQNHKSSLSTSSLDTTPNHHLHQLDIDHLADKNEQLVGEVDEALAMSGEARIEKLSQLRERLKTKNQGEIQAPSEPVPTISTITHHRP